MKRPMVAGRKTYPEEARQQIYAGILERTSRMNANLHARFKTSRRRFAGQFHMLFWAINRSLRRLAIVDDKPIFSKVVRGFGVESPELIGIYRSGQFISEGARGAVPFEEAVRGFSGEMFIKPRYSAGGGAGAFVLKCDGTSFSIMGNEATLDEVLDRFCAFGAHDGLIQSRVEQHPAFSRLYGSAVNTLRVLTLRSGPWASVAGLTLKIGAGGGVVDNAVGGGVFIHVDAVDGTLGKFASTKTGTRIRSHPDTNIEFLGYKLPFIQETLSACTYLHAMLGGIHSIGWDMAVTESGPLVIEANPIWSPFLISRFDPDLCYRVCEILLDDPDGERYWNRLGSLK